jgi:uncharacterized integral membrane protein
MRTLVTFVLAILALAVAGALAVLALQNGRTTSLSFLGVSGQASQGGVIGGAALLGFLVAALLLLPGRVAAGRRARTLRRRVSDLEGQLSVLDLERRRLEAVRVRALGDGTAAAGAAPEPPHRTADLFPPSRHAPGPE